MSALRFWRRRKPSPVVEFAEGIKSPATRAQVAQAAAFMDGVCPEWWRRVDPLTLRNVTTATCVMGQAGFTARCNLTGNLLPKWDVVMLSGVYWKSFFHGTEQHWLLEIAARMPAPATDDLGSAPETVVPR